MRKEINKILIIVKRSNGDVFLSSPLINALYKSYDRPQIDLLVNEETVSIAKTLSYVNEIIPFSKKRKKENGFDQDKEIFRKIFRKYDLSINLTTNDRCVVYAILASKNSISAIPSAAKKSWWKRLFLKHSYLFDGSRSIVKNNTSALKLLGIDDENIEVTSSYSQDAQQSVSKKLEKLNIKQYIVFHPSAQYDYKIYPKELRNQLLEKLNSLNVPIIITGAVSDIDLRIKSELPDLENIYDFIGETNLNEYIALSDMAECYIGMDTLNMHISASQNTRVFAIFGPTILSVWSPWCNEKQTNTSINTPNQTYGNITIFQAHMDCVACGWAGCDDNHGKSECLAKIDPKIIFEEVKSFVQN